ncbi:MAG: metalloregulator ArsR/SmtB family transcription factor [Rhodospirillales bacterium]|nr:metalloregulator ArsR/SmtB family transcription factor [Rhodospirillales bacterium]
MSEGPYIAETGALLGDPARANILTALLDGKARTATELAYVAGVSPQTTSAHLAKLTEGRLLALEKQGRHRYYRLAGTEVAELLEALARVAVKGPKRHRPTGPRDQAMRRARTCYDHLAGRLGVALADTLTERGHLLVEGKNFALAATGEAFLGEFGVDLAALRQRRRAFARSCLDWSERRPHVAGALGAALAERCFELGWVARVADSRSLRITQDGHRGLAKTFDVKVDA